MRSVALPFVAKPLADVHDVELFAAAGAEPGAPPDLLIEVPHGATRRRHFAATRRRLVGEFSDDLEEYFFANTDVGSIECARWVARMVTTPERFRALAEHRGLAKALVLRGLVARTFIDCNRVISGAAASAGRAGLTPGLPAYVREPQDVRTLTAMHDDYQAAAARAYAAVCGAGGRALILHTYAPRSVRLENFDEGIVAALRRAYQPGTYERWERRPAVDLITESVAGERLAPADMVRALREDYALIGVEATENATYRLHEATMGYVHSTRYPAKVLCLEINRELLADPFTPFAEMSIDESRARRMAAPIAAALLRGAAAQRSSSSGSIEP